MWGLGFALSLHHGLEWASCWVRNYDSPIRLLVTSPKAGNVGDWESDIHRKIFWTSKSVCTCICHLMLITGTYMYGLINPLCPFYFSYSIFQELKSVSSLFGVNINIPTSYNEKVSARYYCNISMNLSLRN